MIWPTTPTGPDDRAAPRPRIHLTPPIGWMNDPNGIGFDAGPIARVLPVRARCPALGQDALGSCGLDADLLTWTHLPVALEPGPTGSDRLGCWSGCLVIPAGEAPRIFYTGVSGTDEERSAAICTASSDGGLTSWTKDGAVRPSPERRPGSGGTSSAIHSSGETVTVGDARRGGTRRWPRCCSVVSLARPASWRYVGPLFTTDDAARADVIAIGDIDGPCWECPQLLRFGPIDVLVVSIVDRAPSVRPAHVVAFSGRLEGDRFVATRGQRLGLGPDFYAPSTIRAPDGRYLLFGWIPEDPPEDGSTRTWAGSLTLPRIVSAEPDGTVSIALAREVANVAGRHDPLPAAVIDEGRPWVRTFDRPYLDPRASIAPGDASSVRIDPEGPGGLEAEVRYDRSDRRITVSRMGRVAVAGRDPHGSDILPADPDDRVDLRILVDGSILEVVADQRITATVRRPDHPGGGRLSIFSIGGTARLFAASLTGF